MGVVQNSHRRQRALHEDFSMNDRSTNQKHEKRDPNAGFHHANRTRRIGDKKTGLPKKPGLKQFIT